MYGCKAFRLHLCVSLSVSLPAVSVNAPLTHHPPSLYLSISVSLALPVALFICDSGDSRSFILYFALSLRLSLTLFLFLPLSLTLSLSLSLSLLEACSLSSSISLKLVLSLTLSLFVCLFLTISLSVTITFSLSVTITFSLSVTQFSWLAEIGSTRHASTSLLATQPFLPSLACQTLSGESRQRDWYYIPE